MALPKKIQLMEAYLKSHGPPPYLSIPYPAQGFVSGRLNKEIISNQECVQWTLVESVYDKTTHYFTVNTVFEPKETTPISNLTSSLLQNSQRNYNDSTSSTTTSAAGSPSTRQRNVAEKTKDNDNSTALLNVVVDLRNYDKGYEISVHLSRIEKKMVMKDVSNALTVHVSEVAPEPSHLIAVSGKEKPRKHAVRVSARPGLSQAEYKLQMTLARIPKERLDTRGTRLTVSGVLGEEDDQWHGLIVLNGREIQLNTEERVPDNSSEPLLSEEKEEERSPEAADASLGSGVVAAALEGVSASVNVSSQGKGSGFILKRR